MNIRIQRLVTKVPGTVLTQPLQNMCTTMESAKLVAKEKTAKGEQRQNLLIKCKSHLNKKADLCASPNMVLLLDRK